MLCTSSICFLCNYSIFSYLFLSYCKQCKSRLTSDKLGNQIRGASKGLGLFTFQFCTMSAKDFQFLARMFSEKKKLKTIDLAGLQLTKGGLICLMSHYIYLYTFVTVPLVQSRYDFLPVRITPCVIFTYTFLLFSYQSFHSCPSLYIPQYVSHPLPVPRQFYPRVVPCTGVLRFWIDRY